MEEKNITKNDAINEKIDEKIEKSGAKSTKKDKETTNNDENLKIYESFRKVPNEAQREIEGGKLKGFTDINPMWRIKKLTELFGPCGIGWKAPILEKWTETGANGEVIANVKIGLSIKYQGVWSEPIDGIGGSMLINTEKSKLTSNDEAFKMAYTDALSVACKMLGGGADVYFEKDRTKYDTEGDGTTPKTTQTQNKSTSTKEPKAKTKYQIVKDLINGTSVTFADVEKWAESKAGTKQVNSIPDELFDEMIKAIKAKIEKDKKGDNQTPWDEN